MSRFRLVCLASAALAVLLVVPAPASAHHSFSAEFDNNQPVQLTGTVVQFEFMNPHSWIHMDVPDADGKIERWKVETGSTNALFRRGWRKDSLREGDKISVDAFRAKDGTNTANARTVQLPSGRQFDAASSSKSVAGESPAK